MQHLIRQQMIIETIAMVFAVATSSLSALYRRCMETALGKRRMRQLWDSPRSSIGKRRRARSRRLIFSFHRVREESVTGIFCQIYANGAEFSTAKVKENPAWLLNFSATMRDSAIV